MRLVVFSVCLLAFTAKAKEEEEPGDGCPTETCQCIDTQCLGGYVNI